MSRSNMSGSTSDDVPGAATQGESAGHPDPGKKLWARCLMQVLWPAFVGAGVTVGLLFSLIDPLQIEWVNLHLNDSRQASYTIGFLLFWALYALTCSVTWYLAITETPKGPWGRHSRQ